MDRYFERKFTLPLIVILIGAAFVPFGLLSGEAWAGLAGTLTSGFFALHGWQQKTETTKQITLNAKSTDS